LRRIQPVTFKEEPLTLSIETATRSGSVSLLRGRSLLSKRTGDATRSHSTDLLQLIRESLEEGGHSLQEVDLFSVALGPGSFTGLRIGIATVKSLASTLERRTLGVPTLHAVALSAGQGARVEALLPAGRGELFAQGFGVEENQKLKALDEPTHIAPQALLERLRGERSVLWVGEGAFTQQEVIRAVAEAEGIPFFSEDGAQEKALTEGWVVKAPVENLALYVGLLAHQKFMADEASRPEELQAIYVRLSDAELKEKCRT
jgi:tRNA threonylcarbamoyladenosine biosynthesis protein TsaB